MEIEISGFSVLVVTVVILAVILVTMSVKAVPQGYVDALGKFASSDNQKTFFLPLEATSLIGAVDGIAEIARDAMQQRQASRPGGPWGSPDARDGAGNGGSTSAA